MEALVEDASPAGVKLRHRPWRAGVLVLLVALAVIAAGFGGWVIRGGDKSSAPSVAEAGRRYEALAQVVRTQCSGGVGSTTQSAVESAFGGGYCEGSMTAMAAALRSASWPTGTSDEAAALADALDKHIAFNQRVRAATPAEQQQIVADAISQYPNNPWMVTNRAANAMRKVLGLLPIGSQVAV